MEVETINRLKLLRDFQLKNIVLLASPFNNEQVDQKQSLMFELGLDADRVPTIYYRIQGKWIEAPDDVMNAMTKISEEHQSIHPLLSFYHRTIGLITL
jgi:hypothetical protein